MLEITALKKSYGLKPVLRGIDLSLPQGQCMALLGANGAGKTTLLRLLAGLIKPDAGTICIAGKDILHDAQQVRRLVGFVGHQPYLYEELTALENLLFFGRMYGVSAVQERAQHVLSRVGLERHERNRVSTFSRGQVQRLAWARALLHEPKMLVLDEPDTGLDQEGNRLIETLLAEHTGAGGTTLFTTHSLERAVSLADRVGMLNSGRIVYQRETQAGELESIRQTYQEVVR